MRIVLASLLVLLGAIVAPAHADPEIETIECAGSLEGGVVTTSGFNTFTGVIGCRLGHGGYTGYTTYETFSSPVRATVTSTQLTQSVHLSGGDLYFDSPTTGYALRFDDITVNGVLTMVNQDDQVRFGHVYRYNVRAGFIEEPCVQCLVSGPQRATVAETAALFRFVAEYVYDLPVG